MAIDMLGHYLATAQDDGKAWFQLGRFYMLDTRDWHLQGHGGDPDGHLYLDFASTHSTRRSGSRWIRPWCSGHG